VFKWLVSYCCCITVSKWLTSFSVALVSSRVTFSALIQYVFIWLVVIYRTERNQMSLYEFVHIVQISCQSNNMYRGTGSMGAMNAWVSKIFPVVQLPSFSRLLKKSRHSIRAFNDNLIK